MRNFALESGLSGPNSIKKQAITYIMKKFILDLKVSSVEALSPKHVLIKLTDEKPLPDMLPGQFVEVRVDDSPTTFLRRPISINFVDRTNNELWLLVAAIGDGTRRLSRLQQGDTLNCVLPLGNGFTMPRVASEKVLLVGGGVGVAPLLYFGQKIKEQGGEPTFLLGARTAADLLELDLFKAVGRVFVTTEDGSEGERGFVTNHSVLTQERFDQISTCGPKPMMMAVARYAKAENISCEVSLENKMACGVGACLCCVEKTTEGNVCVCKEGPVLNINKLSWQI
jgi:dihydroorotate dehydrogenase electron transfer subunit